MPDKYHLHYQQEGIIDIMIDRLKTDVEATIIMVIRSLARFATKSNILFL